jgi:uncharacterized protein YfaP (DUF2135 family)
MRGKKGILGVAIVAALALSVVIAGTSASASGGTAVVAKKKCKKHKKQADSAKKKCKKKKKKVTPPAPVVRATLTWSNADNPGSTDLDLYVFDASGNRAGNGSDTIPSSSLSSDVTGGSGTETFTDLAPVPARALSFGVCYFTGGSAHVDYTITYVTADGVTHTDSKNPGSSDQFDYPADGVAIPPNYCNFA